jgi:O-antigen/teichoic acid export membrane protein
LKQLKKIPKRIWADLRTDNSFIQNFAYLFSASALGSLIQFAFFPILSRIYSPEAYGIFGLFAAFSGTLALIAGANLSRAFVLPEKEEDFKALLHTSIRLSFWFSFLVFIISIVASEPILRAFDAQAMGNWIYLLGPAVFLIALDRILIDWSVRQKAFKAFATYTIPTALGTKIFNVLYGMTISNRASGLIITYFINYFVRCYLYLRYIISGSSETLKSRPSASERKRVFKNYKDFSYYLLPGNFLNNFSGQIPIFFLPVFGMSIIQVGIYTFSLLLLDLPVRLLSSAIGPVLLQKSAETSREGLTKLAEICWRLYRNLLFISFFFILVLYVAGEDIYIIAFGEKWAEAGAIAGVLGLGYYLRIASSPLSSVIGVIRKEKQLFYFQVTLFLLRVVSLSLGYITHGPDLYHIMVYYTIGNVLAYILLALWVFKLLKFPLWRVIILSSMSLLLLVLLGEGIKLWLRV